MRAVGTALEGVTIVETEVFGDVRGTFAETFSERWFFENVARVRMVQDNESFSVAGVIRGLHFQKPPHEQAKLVRVVSGRIIDVAVDFRADSATFLRWVAVELSGENRRQLFVPTGFAHGFRVLEDAVVAYKVSDFYHPECDGGVRWDDPTVGVDWCIRDIDCGADSPIVSVKDAALPRL